MVLQCALSAIVAIIWRQRLHVWSVLILQTASLVAKLQMHALPVTMAITWQLLLRALFALIS